MPYNSKIVELYENPKNVGSFSKDEKNVFTGYSGEAACGDVMKLQIKIGQNGKIEDARFKTFGCVSAIASSSLATEWLKGKTLDEAKTIKNRDLADALDLPPVKFHCSILAEEAIKGALRQADEELKKNS